MLPEYDIVVVGGGPAGSIAAAEAARGGARVLLVDRSTRIGEPVRCGELIRTRSLEAFVPEPGPWVVNRFDEYRVVVPSGDSVRFREPQIGCLLDRRIFDQLLVTKAAAAGAAVATQTGVCGLLRSSNAITGVIVENQGARKEVGARMVIGADGVGSRVARFAGINSTLGQRHMASTAFTVARHRGFGTACELHFGQSMAPGGYIWVFGKGDGSANVGAGVAGRFLGGLTAAAYLSAFVDSRYPGARLDKIRAGGIPIGMPMQQVTAPGLMLVGDAARQVNPLTGAGIHAAMQAGRICGRVAAACIQTGDGSREALSEYPRLWAAAAADFHQRSYTARRLLDGLTDQQLNAGAKFLGAGAEEKSVAGAIMALIEAARTAGDAAPSRLSRRPACTYPTV